MSSTIKTKCLGDFLGGPVVKTLGFQGVRVDSLGGELGSHMLHGLAPTKKKKKKTKYFLYHAHYVTFQCAPGGAGQLSIYPGCSVADGMSMTTAFMSN